MFPVRLACVKHAASVHPEPGSNSLIKFVSGQDNLWLPIPFTVCWLLTVRYSMKFALSPPSHKPDVSSALFKNFRESYVSHCSVIKVPVSQTACLLYHIFQILSSTFLIFLKKFFQVLFPAPPAIRLSGIPAFRHSDIPAFRHSGRFLMFRNLCPSDSLFTLSHFPFPVNNFFKFFKLFKLYI